MEVTGKNQDECIVALHDCNGDVNKAINILLEGNSDTVSIINWFAMVRLVSCPILHFHLHLIWGWGWRGLRVPFHICFKSRKNTNLKWLFLLCMVSSWSCRIWRLERELGHLLQLYTVAKILWACGHFHHLKNFSWLHCSCFFISIVTSHYYLDL